MSRAGGPREESDLAALDAQLCLADYIAEAAVVDGGASPGLTVVAVPDEAALIRDGMVDPAGTTFFTIRRRAAELPEDHRPVRFLLVADPLPRDGGGHLLRDELRSRVERGVEPWRPGVRTARLAAAVAPPSVPGDAAERAVLAALAGLTPAGAPEPRPEHDLALDLGLDSLDRLTALAEVEGRLGRRLPDAAARSATAGDLVAAARSPASGAPPSLEERIAPAPGGEDARRADRVSRIARWLRPVRAPLMWAWTFAMRRLLDVEVTGVPGLPPPPFILCPNHLSVLDPFFLAVLPARARERTWNFGAMWIFRTRLGLPALYLGRCLPVDNRQGDFLPALRRAGRILQKGESLIIFPEGMRSYEGEPGEFRPGAALLAALHRVPLVPVGLGGPHRVLGLGAERARHRDARGRRIRIRVAFGEPIGADPLPGETPIDAARRVSERLRRDVRAILAGFPAGLVPWEPPDAGS